MIAQLNSDDRLAAILFLVVWPLLMWAALAWGARLHAHRKPPIARNRKHYSHAHPAVQAQAVRLVQRPVSHVRVRPTDDEEFDRGFNSYHD